MSGLVENTAKGLHKEIMQIIPDKSYKFHADIGCGSGAFLKRLEKNSVLGFGFDINKKNFKYKEAEFIEQDLNKEIKWEKEYFDLITCIEVIEHVENQFLLMKEMSKILSKKGYLVVSSPNIYNIWSKLLFFFNGTFINFMDKNVEEHINPLVENVFEKKIVKDCGLEIVGKFYSSFHIPFTNVNVPLKSKFFGNNVIYLIKKTGVSLK